MTTTTGNTVGKGWFSIDFTGGTAYSAHPIASVLNPEGASVLVTDAIVYIKTSSTGAANLTVGLGTSATGDYSDMMTATAMAAAAGKFYTARAVSASAQTEITAPGVWLSTEYLNVTGSASTAGLTGVVYVEYLRLE
jgi:hypothetical protein